MFRARVVFIRIRCRVAVVEGGSARTIEVTDVVTFDDELSPLQVREFCRLLSMHLV